MKVKNVIEDLKDKKFIDENEIYVYASLKNIIGGAIGSIRGLVLLSINENILYIHHANRNCTGRIDNNEDILRISPKRVFQNKKLQ